MRIPNHVVRNNTVRLECHFDMNGEALYSVKWYKDGYEFYRYVPRDHPPAQVFDQNGVYVNVRRKSFVEKNRNQWVGNSDLKKIKKNF